MEKESKRWFLSIMIGWIIVLVAISFLIPRDQNIIDQVLTYSFDASDCKDAIITDCRQSDFQSAECTTMDSLYCQKDGITVRIYPQESEHNIFGIWLMPDTGFEVVESHGEWSDLPK